MATTGVVIGQALAPGDGMNQSRRRALPGGASRQWGLAAGIRARIPVNRCITIHLRFAGKGGYTALG